MSSDWNDGDHGFAKSTQSQVAQQKVALDARKAKQKRDRKEKIRHQPQPHVEEDVVIHDSHTIPCRPDGYAEGPAMTPAEHQEELEAKKKLLELEELFLEADVDESGVLDKVVV